MRQQFLALALACLACLGAASAVSIEQFGAVANDTSTEACVANSAAIVAAIKYASVNGGTDKTVVVPHGQRFYILSSYVDGVQDVTLRVDGKLLLSNNQTAWADKVDSTGRLAALYLSNCTGFRLTGSGVVDGQGYNWWWTVLLKHVDHRPDMVVMESCENVTIDSLFVRNSPKFHFSLSDMLNLHVYGVTIHVDVIAIHDLYEQIGGLHYVKGFPIPTFPLNTDGIDPSGKNILIEDCYIENFDDAVAVKPQNGDGQLTTCSEDIVVRNMQVAFGVGMSIGSVDPKKSHNCVRNVTFDTITYKHPIKAIYIKTDPGTTGTASITDITYKNIHATLPLWYPIWIGPQQQHQPGEKSLGCSFLYPIDKTCPTNPLVTISDVTLQNVTLEEGLTLPGVLLCNATNPCSDFTFDSVTNTGSFFVQKDYVCENVQGTATNSTPPPGCF